MWSIESLSMLLYRRDWLTAAIGLGVLLVLVKGWGGGRLRRSTIAFELGVMPCV